MEIITDYTHCPPAAQACVVALGNFDGVHLGHQKVIGRTRDIARKDNVPSAVMTFEPHPISVLRPDVPPFRLGTPQAKAALIAKLGIDYLFSMAFDKSFAQLSAESFINDILVTHLKVSHVVIGHDFIFGHKRSGNAQLLEEMAGKNGFGFTQVQSVGKDDVIYSSTGIRQHLASGRPEEAALMLGRIYRISGIVQKGDQRGRKLGFPTANIALGDLQRPAYGVYAVHVTIGESPLMYKGVANIGVRPTFDGEKELLEVYIFDFNEEIYEQQLHVELVRFIRPEKTFDGIEALKAAIDSDCKQALGILR